MTHRRAQSLPGGVLFVSASDNQGGTISQTGQQFGDVIGSLAAGATDTITLNVLPTAAGLEEPGSPRRWMQLGLDHFTRLGAQVSAAAILSKEDAHDPQWLELLNAADFIYYSGGNPQHLIATMSSSPAWTRR